MPDFRILPAGDTGLVVEFGDRIDLALNNLVLALARRLHEKTIDGVIECVPTLRSLMIYYDPLAIPYGALAARVEMLARVLRAIDAPGRLWRLPVCYEPDFATDLADVAARTSLTRAQVVDCHSTATYHVYMLGFLPGQAYMGDLAPNLALPRRETPRMKIPAGSLGITGKMTCIFPQETPCGWHIIGRSPVPLWDRRWPLPLLQPGDSICFEPVSVREYDLLRQQVAAGSIAIAPVATAEAAA